MKIASKSLRRFLPLVLIGLAAGCGGAGSPDTEPTAPPITAENLDDLTKEVEAGRSGMKPLQ